MRDVCEHLCSCLCAYVYVVYIRYYCLPYSYSYIDVLIHISTETPFKVLSGKQNTTTNEKPKLKEIGMFYFLHKH